MAQNLMESLECGRGKRAEHIAANGEQTYQDGIKLFLLLSVNNSRK